MPFLNNIEDLDFQNSIIYVINNRQDLQKFLLGSIDIGENIQEGTNLAVTNNKLNDATVRSALDPVYKSVLRRQNFLEIVFKDISIFDAQNHILRNLLKKIESGKLADVNIQKFLRKAPDIKDIEIN